MCLTANGQEERCERNCGGRQRRVSERQHASFSAIAGYNEEWNDVDLIHRNNRFVSHDVPRDDVAWIWNAHDARHAIFGKPNGKWYGWSIAVASLRDDPATASPPSPEQRREYEQHDVTATATTIPTAAIAAATTNATAIAANDTATTTTVLDEHERDERHGKWWWRRQWWWCWCW